MDMDVPTSDEINGVTDGASSSVSNNVHATFSNVETNENVELNGIMNNTRTLLSNIETNDSAEVNRVTNNVQTTDTSPNKWNIKGVTDNGTQATTVGLIGDGSSADVDQIEPETLPDLVSTQNIPSALTDANTTEDEDEAAEALLQLSKSDTILEDDTELPLGVLPVDVAPVPVTLGNEDILNAIENFKNTENETTITNDKKAGSDNSKNDQDGSKDLVGEKENKDNTEANKQQSQPTPESPLTSPTKGNLVIVKHGIKQKRGSGCSYKCT